MQGITPAKPTMAPPPLPKLGNNTGGGIPKPSLSPPPGQGQKPTLSGPPKPAFSPAKGGARPTLQPIAPATPTPAAAPKPPPPPPPPPPAVRSIDEGDGRSPATRSMDDGGRRSPAMRSMDDGGMRSPAMRSLDEMDKLPDLPTAMSSMDEVAASSPPLPLPPAPTIGKASMAGMSRCYLACHHTCSMLRQSCNDLLLLGSITLLHSEGCPITAIRSKHVNIVPRGVYDSSSLDSLQHPSTRSPSSQLPDLR